MSEVTLFPLQLLSLLFLLLISPKHIFSIFFLILIFCWGWGGFGSRGIGGGKGREGQGPCTALGLRGGLMGTYWTPPILQMIAVKLPEGKEPAESHSAHIPTCQLPTAPSSLPGAVAHSLQQPWKTRFSFLLLLST